MKKFIAVLIIMLVAFMVFLSAGCKRNDFFILEQEEKSALDKCPLNMINPYSCKEGAVTYTDENGCSVTKCRENIKDEEGIKGSEQTIHSEKV